VTPSKRATPDKTPTSRPAKAGRSPSAWILFATISIVGAAADLLSKSAVFSWVLRVAPTTGSKQVIPGMLRFTLSTNPGVVFGMDWIPDMVVVGATVAAAGLVVWFFIASDRRARVAHVALGLILAGAAGNLYDRLFSSVHLPGRAGATVQEVRDFIDFSQLHVGPLNYPWVFNIADVFLVIGVGILLILSFGQWRRERAAKSP